MRPEPLSPRIYAVQFQVNKDGYQIFEEMCRVFYDQQSHTSGDPYETAFKEGQRSVMAFIINKIATAEQPQLEEE